MRRRGGGIKKNTFFHLVLPLVLLGVEGKWPAMPPNLSEVMLF